MCMCGTILFINGALSLVISKFITAIELSAICIGNHMISSAFWDKSARVNFSRLTKLHEPVRLMKFVVFEKFTRAVLSQIAPEKSCDF